TAHELLSLTPRARCGRMESKEATGRAIACPPLRRRASMLDLIKLVPQIQEMTRRVVAAGPGLEERRAAAERRLRETADAPERLARLPRDRSEPRMALPTHEPIDACFAAPPRPGSVTVMAVDGSQIEPDFHEISACYVINV